jgi:hypothetical protein
MRNFILGISLLLNAALLYLVFPAAMTKFVDGLVDKYTAVRCPSGYVCSPTATPSPAPTLGVTSQLQP